MTYSNTHKPNTNWHAPAREMFKNGSSVREIAKFFQRAEKSVQKIVGPVREARTKNWHDEACEMYANGVPVNDIAEHFGKDRDYVLDILARRGLRQTAPQTNRITKRNIESQTPSADRPRELRRPKQILNREAMPDAFGAWLAGLISRDEMMERISS